MADQPERGPVRRDDVVLSAEGGIGGRPHAQPEAALPSAKPAACYWRGSGNGQHVGGTTQMCAPKVTDGFGFQTACICRCQDRTPRTAGSFEGHKMGGRDA